MRELQQNNLPLRRVCSGPRDRREIATHITRTPTMMTTTVAPMGTTMLRSNHSGNHGKYWLTDVGSCSGGAMVPTTYRHCLPLWCVLLPRRTQITTTAMIITRIAAATGTTRFKFDRKMRIGLFAPWSGISRAGAIVPATTPNQKMWTSVENLETPCVEVLLLSLLQVHVRCYTYVHLIYLNNLKHPVLRVGTCQV